MEAATELATAHSIILRLAPPLLASLALSTCSASIGRFHIQRFRVFRCLMFLLHGVRTSVRARSAAYPAGYWIRDHHHLYSNQINFDTYDIYYSRRSCICATSPTPPPPLTQSNMPVHARALYILRVSTGLLV